MKYVIYAMSGEGIASAAVRERTGPAQDLMRDPIIDVIECPSIGVVVGLVGDKHPDAYNIEYTDWQDELEADNE